MLPSLDATSRGILLDQDQGAFGVTDGKARLVLCPGLDRRQFERKMRALLVNADKDDLAAPQALFDGDHLTENRANTRPAVCHRPHLSALDLHD